HFAVSLTATQTFSKKPGPAGGPVSVIAGVGAGNILPEGNKLPTGDSGRIPSGATARLLLCEGGSSAAMPNVACQLCAIAAHSRISEMPALRVGDKEVPEHLDARNRFEFFRIDEIGIERERFSFTEQLHQTAVFLDEIVGQHRDTKPTLARAQHTEHVVDRQMRCARAFAVATDLQKPPPILQVRRHHSAAKKNDAMFVKFLVRTRCAESLEIIG